MQNTATWCDKRKITLRLSYSGNQYKANGHCDNSIRMSLVASQQGNSKSDRLEHSFSVYPVYFSQENVNLLSILVVTNLYFVVVGSFYQLYIIVQKHELL